MLFRSLAVALLCMWAVAEARETDPCLRPRRSLRRRCHGGGAGASAIADDLNAAMRPIGRWVKNIKKKIGVGANTYSAAKAVTKPLVKKLKRTQKKAMKKLARSNRAILEHVQETATEHVFQMMKNAERQQASSKALRKEQKKLATLAAKKKADTAAKKKLKKEIKKTVKVAKQEIKA